MDTREIGALQHRLEGSDREPSSAAPAVHSVPPPSQRVRWLVSARYDLCFFIGSCALTFLFYGLYRVADRMGFVLHGDRILITYFVFTAFFDHPHIFQTFSRTHLDRAEFQHRKGLYTWGIAAFIAAGFVVAALGWEGQVLVFAAAYGTWHIIRQHWGFLRMYKVLNDDREPLDDWLDGATFYVGMFAGFFNDYADVRGPVVIYGDLRAWFPSLPPDLGEIGWSLFLILLVLFGFRQVWRVMEGKAINLPKILLMAAALTTHYFVFFATATPFLVAEALETAYHDVQYQGWIMHYQKQRFGTATAVPPLAGRAPKRVKGRSSVVGKWLAMAMLYGLLVGVLEIVGLQHKGWAFLFLPFTMLVLFHYYIDGKIWRLRDYPELRALLVKR